MQIRHDRKSISVHFSQLQHVLSPIDQFQKKTFCWWRFCGDCEMKTVRDNRNSEEGIKMQSFLLFWNFLYIHSLLDRSKLIEPWFGYCCCHWWHLWMSMLLLVFFALLSDGWFFFFETLTIRDCIMMAI